MFLQINDGWAISSDENAWIVKKYHEPCESQPNGYWENKTWHTKFEDAIKSLARRQIRLSGAENLADAIKDAQKVAQELSSVLDAEFVDGD
jgi:hypothetical protein